MRTKRLPQIFRRPWFPLKMGKEHLRHRFTKKEKEDGQLKANEEFKDLMKAAFELEISLCPDRQSSSTVVINRNALFRPHTVRQNRSGNDFSELTNVIFGTVHLM